MRDFAWQKEGRVRDPRVAPLPLRVLGAPPSLQGRTATSVLGAAPTRSVDPNGQTDPGAASTLPGPLGAGGGSGVPQMEEEKQVAKLSRHGKGNPSGPTLSARNGVRNAGGSQLKGTIQLAASDNA